MKHVTLLAAATIVVASAGSAYAVVPLDILSAKVSSGAYTSPTYTDGGSGYIQQGPLSGGGYSNIRFYVQDQVSTGDYSPVVNLDAINVRATAGAGQLTFTATESGLLGRYASVSVGPFGSGSGFSSGNLPTGWSVTEKVYYSAANQVFGGTLLGSQTFTSAGQVVTTSYAIPTPGGTSATSAWSLTEQIVIQGPAHTGSLTAGGQSISVGAVPEPSTWALMLVGFAGVAYLGVRRRQQQGFSA